MSAREGSDKDAAPDPVFVERGSDAQENFSAEDLDACGKADEIFRTEGSRQAPFEWPEECGKKDRHLSCDYRGNGLPRGCCRVIHGGPAISFRRSCRHGSAAADNRFSNAGDATAPRNEEVESCKACQRIN